MEQGTAKSQHAGAIKAANRDTSRENVQIRKSGGKPLPLPLIPLPPYATRHTALTHIAPYVIRSRWHESRDIAPLTTTQRYCHPQADTIQRTFEKLTCAGVVTNRGYQLKRGTQLRTRRDR